MNLDTLETKLKFVKNVNKYVIGSNSIYYLPQMLSKKRKFDTDYVIFFIDKFFEKKNQFLDDSLFNQNDQVIYISTEYEPTTLFVDNLANKLRNYEISPIAIVGIGGGIVMDIAKAISNLLTNPGSSENYQGWDLLKNPGIFKIAIPSISGTGAEATRTCVLTNTKNGLKLGMNSEFTIYDEIIMDPMLSKTVPKNQYFYTGMDSYIHSFESLNGNFRNSIGDSYSREAINLCREIFYDDDFMNIKNREKMMVASYLGGCAIATSYVGIVHPFSAGLSVVLNIHHCLANCIVMRSMEKFYEKEYKEFWDFVKKHKILIPKNVCQNLTNDQLERLYQSTIIHEKPLTNALGSDYKKILNKNEVINIFKGM